MKNKQNFRLDKQILKTLQKLAREQLKHRLLADIACDISVCKIEGWDYKEYLQELKNEIDTLINK